MVLAPPVAVTPPVPAEREALLQDASAITSAAVARLSARRGVCRNPSENEGREAHGIEFSNRHLKAMTVGVRVFGVFMVLAGLWGLLSSLVVSTDRLLMLVIAILALGIGIACLLVKSPGVADVERLFGP